MSLLIKAVNNFLGLTDTPAAFTGEGGKVAQVNVGETALEFASLPPRIDLLGSIYEQFQQKLLEDWVETIGGTGTTTYSTANGDLIVDSGATAGGTAIRHFAPILGSSPATYEVDWDDELIIQFILKFYTAGVAIGDKVGFARIARFATASILADLGVGFGYERNGTKLFCESHDGVAREVTDLGIGSYVERLFTMAGGTVLRIHHRPNGEAKVKFYVLNAAGGFDLVGTHETRVPSGMSSGGISIAANNQTTDSIMQVTITHAQLYRPIPV